MNLEDKFTELEAQVATQHTAIANKLDAILAALGAPPPTATITLADIADLLITLNASIAGQRLDASAFYEVMSVLTNAISTNTDTIISNNSLNAQRTIAAIMQLYCACDPDTPLFPTPLDTTLVSADDEAICKRIQYFADLYATFVIRVGDYIVSGAAISGRALDDALQGVLLGKDITTGELAAAGGIPDGVRSAAVDQLANQMILDGRPAVREGLLDIVGLETTTILREALYTATNAAEGKAAFDAAILTAPVGNKYAEIGQTLFYSAWANDMFGTVPVVDDSLYDGSICAPSPINPGENCITIESTYPVTTDDPQTYNAIVWPNFGTNVLPSSVRPPGYPSITASADLWYNGSNLNGYWIRGTTLAGAPYSGRVYLKSDGTVFLNFTGSYQQITVDTDYVVAFGFDFNPFLFEICEAEPEIL